MKKKLIILFVLLGFSMSCRKDKEAGDLNPGLSNTVSNALSLDQVKQWYSGQRSAANGLSTASTNPSFSLSKLNFTWEKAQSITNKSGNYWLVHLEGKPKYRNVQFGYRKLAFQRDSTGRIQARILEIIPDPLYIQRKQQAATTDFSGRIFIYDAGYHLLGGRIMAGGKQIGEIKSKSSSQPAIASPQIRINMVQVTESCTWYDDNYIDSEGVVTIYSERICDYSIYDDGAVSGGGGFDGGGGDYAGGGGGGGGDASSAPAVSNLPGENHPKADPKKMMDCFGNIADPNATMTVTVYVQEPFPGTTFNYGPNSVGHTAIGLSKTGGGTSITQVVGFYPDASGKDKMHAPSKVVDNTADPFNASISYTVSAAQFSQIAGYISNPPATYDLVNFNCTNFVAAACQQGGITIPDSYNTVGLSGPGGATVAMTPAGLGNSIEKLKGNPNVNINGGDMPKSKGPCN